MGRAIVREPQVFLMDEPLSNLDAKLRVQMRAEIAKLQHELDTTTIYVTHDQVEAMTMGDRVAVMSMGVLQQVDRPQQLYDAPAERLRRELHRDAADESVPRNHPRRTTARSPSRSADERSPSSSRASRGTGGIRALTRPQRRGRCPRRGPAPGADAPGPTRRSTQRVELVEALGSGVMAHFHIDADAYRPIEARGAGRTAAATSSAGRSVALSPRNRTSSRTSRRVSSCGSADTVPFAIDPGALHFFDEETGAALTLERLVAVALAAGALPARRCRRQPRRHVRRAAAVGAGSRRSRSRRPYSALASQRIYFVMPDRYANGDPSNDRGGLTGPRSRHRATTRRTPAGTTAAT